MIQYTQPLPVVAQRGPATYKVSGGKVWNAIHLSRANYPSHALSSHSDGVRAEESYVSPQTLNFLCRRQIRPPVWLRDFET